MWVIRMNLGFSLQLLHKCFSYLIPKMRRNASLFLGNGVDNVEDEEEYKQCKEVPFFVDTKRINIVETKISYSYVIPYARTDSEGKLVYV
jgi:hypothetical protein